MLRQSWKPDARSTTKIRGGTHTTYQKTDITFSSLQSTLQRSSLLLQMSRVYDDWPQHWRASMILCSSTEVTKQCTVQTLQGKCSAALSDVRIPPKCGKQKAPHREALERQRRRILSGRWRGCGGLLRCQSGPTIQHTFFRPILNAVARKVTTPMSANNPLVAAYFLSDTHFGEEEYL